MHGSSPVNKRASLSKFQKREEGIQQLVCSRLLAPLRRFRATRPVVLVAGRGEGHDDEEPVRSQRRRKRQVRGSTEDECHQIAVAKKLSRETLQLHDLSDGLAGGSYCTVNFLRFRISFSLLIFEGSVSQKERNY